MKRFTQLFPIAAILLVSGCNWIEGGLERIEVIHDTVPFDRIRLETSSDVRIIQSSHYQVVITGRERDVNRTEVRVQHDQLRIEEHGPIANDQEIVVYVPALSLLELVGSSEVYGESEFLQPNGIEIIMTGSGEIDLYIDTDDVDAAVYGSGDILLEGLTDRLDVDITGSGWVRAFPLHSDFTDVRISGSGSAEVHADADLDVLISGTGDVFYKGHPRIHSQISGTGEVIDAN